MSAYLYATDHGRPAEPLLQRKCACGGKGSCGCKSEELEGQALQRSATCRAPEAIPHSVHQALHSPGQSLDPATRSLMERRLGHDFSRVRVHTDARATQSASSVRAAAYTVGDHVVFGAGQYSPQSLPGRALLAHELTHVVQQGSAHAAQLQSMRHGPAALRAEAEAEAVGAQVASGREAQPLSISPSGPGLDRQPAGGGSGSGAAPPPDPHQQMIEEARGAAFIRCLLARDITSGVGPPAPARPDGAPGTDTAAPEGQARARHLAALMFEWPNPNMDQVTSIVASMMTRLAPGISAVAAQPGDANCGARAGYVVGHHPPIVLCNAFFSSTAEERIRTMIHESAHLAGIGQPNGEGYCAFYDCSGPCPGGFDSADSWAQYVTCLTNHGDKLAPVQGRAHTP
ncbi:MAG TPA: DUF4157 domain-containing protein [Acidobacteriaceae bacterium]